MQRDLDKQKKWAERELLTFNKDIWDETNPRSSMGFTGANQGQSTFAESTWGSC